MSVPIDISTELRAICFKLGLEPGNVASLHIEPAHATAIVYDLNANGHKYVGDSGSAATTQLVFKVIT